VALDIQADWLGHFVRVLVLEEQVRPPCPLQIVSYCSKYYRL